MSTDPAAPLDKRGQFISTRKRDLFAALATDLGLGGQANSEAADRFYRLLTATIHHEFLDELEHLHETYFHLDPARPRDPAAPDPELAYAALSAGLERVLQSANFVEVHPELVQAAATQSGRIRSSVRNGVADFRAVRLFRRGLHTETVVRKTLYGLRKKEETIEVYDEVVLFAALKTGEAPVPKKRLRKSKKRPNPPGSVMIKCFHNIASADLEALYPDVQVVMTTADKLTLGVPALVAGIPLLIKLAPAFFVLYGLLRFYLGEPAPGTDGVGEALIVASGVLALGGFLMNQWMKYERRALLYQREVNDMIYFHNVTNNVGIFDHIIGNAEEQECKEALLAYGFLASEPMTEGALDRRIEEWLAKRFGLHVDFDVGDALDKLSRFGLLRRDGEQLSVLPLPVALAELDRRWDGLFQFAGPAPETIAAD